MMKQIKELFTKEEIYELKKMHQQYKLKKQEAIKMGDQEALKNIEAEMRQNRIQLKKVIDERAKAKL